MTKTITFQPSKYLKHKIKELVKSGEFNNQSQLINTALTEWIRDYEQNQAENAYWKEEDRKATENTIRKLIRKGMTRTEAKEFIKRVEEDFDKKLITLDKAQEAIKTGKLKGYKPKKK